MKKIGDILPDKIRRLNLDRADDIKAIQVLLDDIYAGKAKARSLNNGVLKITTQSASIAGDMRLRQVELMKNIKDLSIPVESLIIRIA